MVACEFSGARGLTEKRALKNRKIGLITNHTGNNFDLESNFDLMLRAGYKMTALFSPEHGIYRTTLMGSMLKVRHIARNRNSYPQPVRSDKNLKRHVEKR